MSRYTDKYLIINADDLGYNEEQNAAITELYRAGEISSVSVLTVTACAESGARTAREEGMSAGIHFALTSDEENARWHSVSGARSLADDKGLYTGGFRLAMSARRKDVRKELEAQYSFLTSRGVTPDYADSHSGTLYGINGRRFYRDAFEFCRERDLPFRFPRKTIRSRAARYNRFARAHSAPCREVRRDSDRRSRVKSVAHGGINGASRLLRKRRRKS